MDAKPIEQGISEQVVSVIQRKLAEHLVAVILFGSRARGDASDESDWDLLVIAEGLPEKPFERYLSFRRLLPIGCRGTVSVRAKTPEEFEAHLPSLYLDIALDGQILYDSRGYAAERMAALRRLIKKMGLYREHTEAGDVWRWEKVPAGPWALEWEK